MFPTTPTIGRYNAEGFHSSACSLQECPGPGFSANFNDTSMGRRVGSYGSSLAAASYLPSPSSFGGQPSTSSSSFQPAQRSVSGIYTDPYNYCIPSTIEFTHFRMGFMGPTTMGHSAVSAGGMNFPLSLPNQQSPASHFHNNLTIATGLASSTTKPLAIYGHRGSERPQYALSSPSGAAMQPGPQTPLLSHIGAWRTTEQGMIATHPQVTADPGSRSDIANQPLDRSRLHGARRSAAKLYSCETCGKQYCRKGTLKSHMREHSGVERPFNCQLCGKTFSQQANLIAHRRIHTGEKPFRCPVCHRPFSQSSSLVTHKSLSRTHTGERPYPCAECDKAFADSSTLTKHLRTHTGQKPYICSVCRMRFSQSGNLHRHMKTHVNSKSPYR